MKAEQNKELYHQMKMVTAVAYDLRDPATVILMAKDALEKLVIAQLPEKDQKKAQGPLRYIEKSVNRLERISMNLLDISRSSTGELKPHWESVCISAACKELCEEASAMRQGKNIVCSVPKHPVVIQTDCYFFDRILLNLLSNAMTACPEGKIWVELKEYSNEVVLVVKDSGPGLDAHRLQSPFAPVYRTEDSSMRLGLYISDLLAKQMYATLSAENMPKGGARFVLRIPVEEQGGQQAFCAPVRQEQQTRKRYVEAEFSLFDPM